MKVLLLSSLSALLLTLGQCTPAHRSAANPAVQSAVSTIKWAADKDVKYPVTDNTDFIYIDNYQVTRDQSIGITLQQRIVNIQRPDRECCETRITVTGTPSKGKPWSIASDAHSGEVYERFYRTAEGGCCGSNVRYRYFNLLTGRQRFSATRPLAVIDVAEACCDLDRYLAVDRLSEPGDDTFVAKLQYGGENDPPQITYLIFTPNSQDMAVSYVDVDFLQGKKLISSLSRPQDEAAYPADFPIFPDGYPRNPPPTTKVLTGFSFVLTINKDQRITIPVVEDHLATEKAKLAHGFAFVDAPPKGFDDSDGQSMK